MGGTSTDGRLAVLVSLRVHPFWGSESCLRVLVGFQVETHYWVLRLHAAHDPHFSGVLGRPSGRVGASGCGGVGVWLVLPVHDRMKSLVVCGVGLFLENCIVDASIFVSN